MRTLKNTDSFQQEWCLREWSILLTSAGFAKIFSLGLFLSQKQSRNIEGFQFFSLTLRSAFTDVPESFKIYSWSPSNTIGNSDIVPMYCIKLQRVGSALTMSPGIPIFSISGIQQNQLKVALLALFPLSFGCFSTALIVSRSLLTFFNFAEGNFDSEKWLANFLLIKCFVCLVWTNLYKSVNSKTKTTRTFLKKKNDPKATKH